MSSGLVIFLACVSQYLVGLYVGYKWGFIRGRAEGFVDAIVHTALVLRKVFREVDTVTNGPYTIDRVVNLMGIEEVYNLTDTELPKEK